MPRPWGSSQIRSFAQLERIRALLVYERLEIELDRSKFLRIDRVLYAAKDGGRNRVELVSRLVDLRDSARIA